VTALNFWLNESHVFVVADTLVTNQSFMPAFFTTKVFAVPHWNGLICGTGSLGFILDWHRQVLGGMLATDIRHLHEFAPASLKQLYASQPENFRADSTTTIYHFGLDEAEDQFVGFAYRSTHDFVGERLGYGLSIKPGFDIGARMIEEFPRDFVKLCLEQRQAQEALPVEERVFIGGHVTAFMLELHKQASKPSDVTTTISRPYQFEDFGENYGACVDGLCRSS
jgi:hypothetical protein